MNSLMRSRVLIAMGTALRSEDPNPRAGLQLAHTISHRLQAVAADAERRLL